MNKEKHVYLFTYLSLLSNVYPNRPPKGNRSGGFYIKKYMFSLILEHVSIDLIRIDSIYIGIEPEWWRIQ